MRFSCFIMRWGVFFVLLNLQQVAGASSIVALPSSVSTVAGASSPGLPALQGLPSDFQPESELLPPEKAFTVSVRVHDASTVVAQFKPAHGYYLYRDRIRFQVRAPSSITVQEVRLPDGQLKADPTFGSVAVFDAPFAATVLLKQASTEKSVARLHFTYQGCSDRGVCYPPNEKTFDLTLPALATTGSTSPDTANSVKGSKSFLQLTDAEDLGAVADQEPQWLDAGKSLAMLHGRNVGWVWLGFFGFGLLLSLTPCVWPMFPILSGVIAGQAPGMSKARAFCLSLAYVLGMAVTYAAMGVAAGLSGTLLSTALQTPWASAAMSLLFVALALSMFGLYEMQMPSFLQSRLAGAERHAGARSGLGVFVTGAVAAVIAGPCIAAPLAGALLYIGQTQDVVLGGSALFALALGKGIPLLAVGTALGNILPRSGTWMKTVKVFLGVLLLGTAVWIALPLIGPAWGMALSGAVLLGYAVYLCAFDAAPGGTRASGRLRQGIGVTSFLVGAFYLIGAVSGAREFSRPLAGVVYGMQPPQAAPLAFHRIASVNELDAKLRESTGKLVMLDFYADWCVSCKEMEHKTFSNAVVRSRLKDAVLLQADVTANSNEHKQLMSRFGLFGPPAIPFFDFSGQEIAGTRVIGFMEADRFAGLLAQLLH